MSLAPEPSGLEAETAVNAYAKQCYGFGPGDDIQMGYPSSGSPVRLRVYKVFLQSGTDSDIRVDASCRQPDGTTSSEHRRLGDQA